MCKDISIVLTQGGVKGVNTIDTFLHIDLG